MKNKILLFGLLLIAFGCNKTEDVPDPIVPVELEISNEVAQKWGKMTMEYLFVQPLKSPTYVSRSLGYIGLTMYETAVNGSIIYKSIASQLNGLGELPKPETGLKYDWETALNSGQSLILRRMYQHAMADDNARLDSLELAILSERKVAVNDTAVISRSIQYGRAIAENIYEWSKTDGGHLAYLKTYDPSYVFPRDPTHWSPPLNGQSSILMPMHPRWGENRTFIPANSQLPVPQILEYSTDKNSAFYKDFEELYNIQKALTQEQKEIANWWGDDPATTNAPPGHSYNLAYQILKIKEQNLFVTSMTYARVGMATADAFINCWKCKFTYHSIRPTPYIRININGAFSQYWPEPPFPAFASGHSTQASAAAEALISIFGDEVAFDDETHVGKPKDQFRNVEYKKRSFTKISDTAIECGISRLYGGIHTAQDNIVGLAEGKKIGGNVNGISWKY
ncbi:phosphatase PAP2 family protein [Lacihabitans sp. LS3-19]|uniref:vanadium-dependent haloperoxidase n=1 Tax=Lacihabitans sp. LS3-19 TaxID=2487335 RepID=UPI0020CED5C7|nr:vanadium-dependent haloperoxidase [Lacihabitans sp. LS3-19]MCP9767294.1 phosphatase PAP2 family protein [Lacihabitans sp. LS3-19]